MICPHCRARLRLRERPNLTCSKCRQRFALDPKTNALKAHDVRVAGLAGRLSDGGKLRYTGQQMWYALSRKTVGTGPGGAGCGMTAAIIALVVSGLCALGGFQEENYGFVGAAAVVWVVVAAAVFIAAANRRARIPEVTMPTQYAEFSQRILEPWRQLYRSDPAGLARRTDIRKVDDPELAVLCPDRSVLQCLQANGIPERLRVALASRIEQVPVGVPVLVLHDASPPGCLLARDVRRQLPGRRVMDGGLRPRHAMAAKGAIRLRARPMDSDLRALGATGLDAKEIAWLTRGWWSPIGAMKPAGLIRRVEEAARRTDPADQAAREVGFLTWPAG